MIHVTMQVVRCCHKCYLETGSFDRQKGSGRPTLHTGALLKTIEEIMQADDEATAVQIIMFLLASYRGSEYCQLIRQADKEKWLILGGCYLV